MNVLRTPPTLDRKNLASHRRCMRTHVSNRYILIERFKCRLSSVWEILVCNTAFAPSDAMGAKQLQEPTPRLRGLFTRVLRMKRRRRRHPSQRRSSKRLILRGQKDAASGLYPTSEAAAESDCPASDLYYQYVFYKYRLIVMYNCEVVYDLDRYVPL